MDTYCKALNATSVSHVQGQAFCCERQFLDFVEKNIDPDDIKQHLADFSQGGDVSSALRDIQDSLERCLQQKLPLHGVLKQIGSFYNGSKTGGLNEMDCFYVITGANIAVKVGSKKSSYNVFVFGDSGEREITPRELNKSLSAWERRCRL